MKRFLYILLALSVFIGCSDDDEKDKEKESVADIYSEITGKCVMKFASQDDILAMLKNGTGVVFLSWDGCPWCHHYIPWVNDIARDTGMEVLYYDIHDDRDKNSAFYQQVVSLLKNALEESKAFDSNGKPRIYIPDVSFVIQGEIIGHDNQSSMEDGGSSEDIKKYWNTIIDNGKTRESILKKNLTDWMEQVKEAKDILDDRGCDDDCKV